MKAAVLGAAGSIGQIVALSLAQRGSFDSLLLVDRRAPEVTLDGVRCVAADLSEPPTLAALLTDIDVVVNCTTYHLGVDILRAAITAGADYVDLGGLYNTPKQLALDAEAKSSGTHAVLGCGATPGLSNLLAAAAAARLDTPREVHISFASHRDLAPSPGLLDTILDEFRPGVDRFFWENGQLISVDAFSGERTVRFPPPIGEQEVFYVPHSELHTLHRNIEGLAHVAVRGTWRPADMKRLRALAELGLTDERIVNVDGTEMSPLSFVRTALLDKPPHEEGNCAFFIHVEVIGDAGGVETKVEGLAWHPLDWGAEATARMTGMPAVVGAEAIAAGRTRGPGVMAPEAAFDPAEIFDAVASLGITTQITASY